MRCCPSLEELLQSCCSNLSITHTIFCCQHCLERGALAGPSIVSEFSAAFPGYMVFLCTEPLSLPARLPEGHTVALVALCATFYHPTSSNFPTSSFALFSIPPSALSCRSCHPTDGQSCLPTAVSAPVCKPPVTPPAAPHLGAMNSQRLAFAASLHAFSHTPLSATTSHTVHNTPHIFRHTALQTIAPCSPPYLVTRSFSSYFILSPAPYSRPYAPLRLLKCQGKGEGRIDRAGGAGGARRTRRCKLSFSHALRV